jgi:hypothetical protein
MEEGRQKRVRTEEEEGQVNTYMEEVFEHEVWKLCCLGARGELREPPGVWSSL